VGEGAEVAARAGSGGIIGKTPRRVQNEPARRLRNFIAQFGFLFKIHGFSFS
jgi:hypothetical protein